MIAEVPSMAIEHISLETNTTSIHDEFLAHRIGLLPIVCHKKISSIPTQEECNCNGGCSLCNLDFMLEKENLSDETTLGVYSSDFKTSMDAPFSYHFVEYPDSSNGILLCQLAKGEKLKLHGTASKGTGKEHIKWSPVSTISYQSALNINEFDFFMETIGSSTPEDIFIETLSILKSKIKALLQEFDDTYVE
jgi:DNA-directed RNA polymerase II subunit RPB3